MPSHGPHLEAQIRWKTDAWKDPAAAAIYAQRVDDRGATLLKNRVEVRMFPRYVAGNDILDVGIGTGRATFRWRARDIGLRVPTGFASDAGQVPRPAGDTPLTLLTGDVAALPFAADSFDTVMALNTFAHFPHWQQILHEWKRVVRPGGRLIFDAFSLDHDIAFARATGRDESYAVERLGPETVGVPLAFGCRRDRRIRFGRGTASARHIVPYSALCGKGTISVLRVWAVEGYAWDRQLTWAGANCTPARSVAPNRGSR